MKTTAILLGILGTVVGFSAQAEAKEAKADVTLPVLNQNFTTDRLILVQNDPHAFLEMALNHYHSSIRDYTCTFIKQEMVRGKMSKEQEMSVKFRESPFSVFMQWTKNPGMVDKALYVEGHHDNQAMIKPAGILGVFVRSHVKRPVDGPDATKVSRRRLDQFGFENTLELIIETNQKALKNNDLKLSYKGTGEVDGRKTFILERFLPDKPHYPDQHLIVHIDQEWLIPMATYCYDAKGKLLGKYLYKDVELNVGLAFREFTPAENGL